MVRAFCQGGVVRALPPVQLPKMGMNYGLAPRVPVEIISCKVVGEKSLRLFVLPQYTCQLGCVIPRGGQRVSHNPNRGRHLPRSQVC